MIPIGVRPRGRPGEPDPADAPAIIGSIKAAVDDVRGGRAAALVTNPIHKDSLYRAGFHHPGHTEYLAELAGGGLDPGHDAGLPAAARRAGDDPSGAAPGGRDAELRRHRRTPAGSPPRHCRRDFGIAAPVLAVAGLNPHAGEAGGLGREEIEIIEPAIAACARDGIDARGPLAADTMFHAAARQILRRGAVHVSRPGADPDQDDRL